MVYTMGSTFIQFSKYALQTHTKLLQVLKENLLNAQHRMSQRSNARRCELTFVVGDLVLVRIQLYHQIAMCQRYHKLSKNCCGPYQIMERINVVANYSYLQRVVFIPFSMFLSLNLSMTQTLRHLMTFPLTTTTTSHLNNCCNPRGPDNVESRLSHSLVEKFFSLKTPK